MNRRTLQSSPHPNPLPSNGRGSQCGNDSCTRAAGVNPTPPGPALNRTLRSSTFAASRRILPTDSVRDRDGELEYLQGCIPWIPVRAESEGEITQSYKPVRCSGRPLDRDRRIQRPIKPCARPRIVPSPVGRERVRVRGRANRRSSLRHEGVVAGPDFEFDNFGVGSADTHRASDLRHFQRSAAAEPAKSGPGGSELT